MDWITPNWDAPDFVRALVTTRAGGFSQGAHSSLNLGTNTQDPLAQKNRDFLVQEIGLANKPHWLNQVHGSRIVRLSGEPVASMDADGSITAEKGCVSAVLTADCLPVLFCDRFGQEVAVAHGGWRGLAKGIIEDTVAAFQSPPEDLLAWLGPAISQMYFEVGGEVREEFLSVDPNYEQAFEANSQGRWQADIYGLARQALKRSGVQQISGGDYCTYRDKDRFYSYRRDGETGRMASLIWRE